MSSLSCGAAEDPMYEDSQDFCMEYESEYATSEGGYEFGEPEIASPSGRLRKVSTPIQF